MNRETAIEIPEAEALEALRQELREERKTHWTASANAKHGIKSDPFRQLERAGQLNAEFFLAEASRIMAKTSTLSASQRAYISTLSTGPYRVCCLKGPQWKQTRPHRSPKPLR